MKKKEYQIPVLNFITFETENVLTASSSGTGGSDENQGEWDPQEAQISDPAQSVRGV